MYTRRERPSEPPVYRDAAFLSSCSEADAIAWLDERHVNISSVFGTPDTPSDAPVLEYILYRRKSPRLDLALAEKGRSQTVLERIYRRSPSAVRVVACGNPSLFIGGDSFSLSGSRLLDQIEAEGSPIYYGKDGDPIAPAKVPLFWKIITNGPMNELRALCENTGLTSGMYLGLVGSWEGDDESNVIYRISTERFQKVVKFLASNPRIHTSRDESAERHFMDGFAEHEYESLFAELWRLAARVPVTREWATCLSSVYAKLVPTRWAIDDPAKVINRWKVEDERKFDPVKDVRTALAKAHLDPRLEMVQSDDPALRRAFYQAFNPERDEFADLDWNEWLERDEYCYLDLFENTNVWKSSRGRWKLNRLLWHKSKDDHDISDIGWFREKEEELQKLHPEWFEEDEEQAEWDDDDERPSDEIATERLAASYKAIDELHGPGTYAAKVARQNALGQNILHEELGYFGNDGEIYKMTDAIRDRLIAHSRQDIAATFGLASGALDAALKAQNASRRSVRMLWFAVALLLIILMVLIS